LNTNKHRLISVPDVRSYLNKKPLPTELSGY